MKRFDKTIWCPFSEKYLSEPIFQRKKIRGMHNSESTFHYHFHLHLQLKILSLFRIRGKRFADLTAYQL